MMMVKCFLYVATLFVSMTNGNGHYEPGHNTNGYGNRPMKPGHISSRSSGNALLRNCKDVQQSGGDINAVYTINPYDEYPELPVQVYCDMETAGGGWTVIQRRADIEPHEDFYRTWTEYRLGFGDLYGEFWLGLKHIHALTEQVLNEIRFDLVDFKDEHRHANYSFFYVHDESGFYKLEVDGYSGTAGDSFKYQNGQNFSTKDADHDQINHFSCAEKYMGGWWFKECQACNLNGLYVDGESPHGIDWSTWKGMNYSLKFTEMKIRPAYN